ncbi:MAG: hypothetical protein NTU58_01510 [Candidatus Nealsonbacteria bacterium]|nr:hypothetical protein [Candidatus Nealsonbacteria bacterium]
MVVFNKAQIRCFSKIEEKPLSIYEIVERINADGMSLVSSTHIYFTSIINFERLGLVKVKYKNNDNDVLSRSHYKNMMCRLTEKGKAIKQATDKVYPTIKKLDEQVENLHEEIYLIYKKFDKKIKTYFLFFLIAKRAVFCLR